MILCFLIW